MHIRALCLFPFAICFLTAMAQPSPEPLVPKLMPQPQSMSVRAGEMPLTNSVAVSLTGYREPRLQRAVDRLYARITAQTGIPLVYGTRNSHQPALVLHTQRASQKIQQLGEDESYRLEVTPE